jgi:protein ImuB
MIARLEIRDARLLQAACLYAAGGSPAAGLHETARMFSPRVEVCGERAALLDVSGLERLIGEPRAVAEAMQRAAAERGLPVHVAIAPTWTAALLLAAARPGVTIAAPGDERRWLAPSPIRTLCALEAALHGAGSPVRGGAAPVAPVFSMPAALVVGRLLRWGVETLGAFAALPPAALAARLGQAGALWQRAARGEDIRPLLPTPDPPPYSASLDLEWPIDGLTPLSFVLGRLLEPLCARLVREERGAAAIVVHLRQVSHAVHVRRVQPPAPIHDARTLRSVALLDLEQHPPTEPFDRVAVLIEPAAARTTQGSLLTRGAPAPDALATLLARLTAIIGEGRCGAPAVVDAHRPDAFTMETFTGRAVMGQGRRAGSEDEAVGLGDPARPACGFRRLRPPAPARVALARGRPVGVYPARRDLPGGRIVTSAGPWRGSGEWWDAPWDREEWDVAVSSGPVYRIHLDRILGRWAVEGVVD